MISQISSRRDKKRAKQRAELVAAARRALAREGIGGLTIEAVATEADVSKPAVHYYFPTKDALAAAVVVEVAAEELAVYERATAGAASFRDACDACVAAFVARYEHDYSSFRAHYVWSQVFRTRDPSLEELPHRAGPLLDRLEKLARADQEKGVLPRELAPRATVNVIAALCAGILARATLLEANAGRSLVSVREVAEAARALLSRALAVPTPRRSHGRSPR